jgi:hypothetical protein
MTNFVLPKFDMSFDEWIKFIFDHPVSEDIHSLWYFDNQLTEFWDEWTIGEKGNFEKQLEYAINLFQEPMFLLMAYSPEQINQGFWFLLNGVSGFGLADLLWKTELPWSLREQCIISMAMPFHSIFVEIPEQDSCNMWWDLLRNFQENRDPKVVDAMFRAMTEILQSSVLACQVSALHGFGHIEHVAKRKVIGDYLDHNATLDKETRDYALAAVKGEIL